MFGSGPDESEVRKVRGVRRDEPRIRDTRIALRRPSRGSPVVRIGAMKGSLEWFTPGRDNLGAFAADLLQLIEVGASQHPPRICRPGLFAANPGVVWECRGCRIPGQATAVR